MLPFLGGVKPMILLKVVVLPAPFLPRRQTASPSFTLKEIPNRI
jgi:hypothetical protein